MGVTVVFETHSTSVDNERGVASGWLPGELSDRGRAQAAELGRRRREDDLAAVFSSDLRRAVQTVSIAFEGHAAPRFMDWRLRECDYGAHNGTSAAVLHAGRLDHLDVPYSGGESWRQAVGRVSGLLADLPARWPSARVLLVGHVATQWALEHGVNGVPLEQLATEGFHWRPGWAYDLPSSPA